MIAQNEAMSYYSRDLTLNITKEQQCFSLLDMHQDRQRGNEQCQTNDSICDHLDEYDEGIEREQNTVENYHHLMSVQHRDTNLNAILARYTQLDDFRAEKRLEEKSMVADTKPEATAAGILEAAPKNCTDLNGKQSSKKSSSKNSLGTKVESLFCNHNNDNNESLINNNIGGVDGDGDDDNTTSVAIK